MYVLWLFWPFIVLLLGASLCLCTERAAEIRARLNILAGSMILGTYLFVCWFHVGDALRVPSLLSRPLVVWILAVTLALMGHALIHLISDMRLLPPTQGKRIASLLIGTSLFLGVMIAVGLIRHWGARYSDRAAWAAHERPPEAYEAADCMTAEWVEAFPDQWEFILLRANTLHSMGDIEEARDLYERLVQRIDGEVPDGLRAWLAQ